MSDQLDVLTEVARRLDQASMPYMLSGSVAMNFYAQPRMTRDIDIVVELFPGDAARVARLFEPDFYVDEQEVLEAIQSRGIFNLIHQRAVVRVDMIVRKDSEYRRAEFARRRRVPLEGVELSLVSPEDLILSKLDWGKESASELQRRDVRNLVESGAGLGVSEGVGRGSWDSADAGGGPQALTDTSPGAQRRFRELLLAKPGIERLRMGCAMFDDAKALALIGLHAQLPRCDERNTRRELFLRLYRGDFTAASLQTILGRVYPA